MGFTSEGNAARATITGLYMQVAFVDEVRHSASLDTANLDTASLDTANLDAANLDAAGVRDALGLYAGITSTSLRPRRRPNLTMPSEVAKRVSSPPLMTLLPG